MNSFKSEFKKLDISILTIPFLLVLIISILFFIFPKASNDFFANVKPFFGDTLSLVYLVVNFGAFILAFYISLSKYGKIVLSDKQNDKPAFSFWAWGAMMFCCGLAGDILYYSFTEWISYSQEPYVQSLGNPYDVSNAYSFFFWANYWLYLVIAVCFAFMIHVRKRNRQKYSEVLRPLLGKQTDGLLGKVIDIFSTFVIIAAVTCSICFTLPIITSCLNKIFGIPNTNLTTIIILILVCIIYSISVCNGLKGIELLSSICIYIFLIFLAYIFIFGGETRFILESSFKQIGVLFDHLIFFFTDIDPTRKSTFVQDYCAFYDAYWLTWTITVPYFIAVISKGRTIKQMVLGGLLFAVPGGLLSYLIIPNFSMAKQIFGKLDIVSLANETGDMYEVIVSVLETLPLAPLVLVILIISMICFCATSFDSISLTCSYYSYKNITRDEIPAKGIRLFWAIILILFPMALFFSNASYENLQNVAVIAGFPAAIIFVLVLIAFFKDANKYLKEIKKI